MGYVSEITMKATDLNRPSPGHKRGGDSKWLKRQEKWWSDQKSKTLEKLLFCLLTKWQMWKHPKYSGTQLCHLTKYKLVLQQLQACLLIAAINFSG